MVTWCLGQGKDEFGVLRREAGDLQGIYIISVMEDDMLVSVRIKALASS